MTFEDLGMGYHLVPVRDHCYVRTGTRRVGPTTSDYEAADRYFYNRGTWDFYRSKAYWDELRAFLQERVNARRLRREALRARRRQQHRDFMLSHYDPMALQAVMILKQVRRDLWEIK